MSVIVRNDFGAVAVNKGVIERMIIEDLLSMSGVLLLCNKKGKVIKEKPTPLIDPDYYDAVDVSEKKGHFTVKIYVIINAGCRIADIANDVFRKIEQDFEMLKLDRPESIQFKIRGLKSAEIEKRSIDVVRNNG
ncbi:MAG: Asp23/Gls24 family envelope stress response protein [Mogibacterium sp.]|nr:Asp23/Gls24 family envelope stress response protein [Mogibacterium sp.]